MKILMVCLGNICRSPLAEGILKNKVKGLGLHWEVESAGTGHWHVGEKPDLRSIDVARNHGIDISDQRARLLRKTDIHDYDLIFAMDSMNYRDIMSYCQRVEEKNKVALIMNMADPGQNQSVPDPYFDNDGFEKVYQMLNKACDAIIKEYRSHNN